tara:strand:- start:69 stop:668 length:600 start_codon:yes stop_codon:yes gene_type:complete
MELISSFEIITAVIVGVCLSACCGFRVFTPFFILSLCNYCFPDTIPLAENMDFICELPAVIGLGTATIVEMIAFYIPWFDNILGAITTPVAGIAGLLLGALILSDINPFFQWTLATIAGGTAVGINVSTETIRLASTTFTAGLGNFIVSTTENLLVIIASVTAIIFPIIALILLIFILIVLFIIARKIIKRKKLKKVSN